MEAFMTYQDPDPLRRDPRLEPESRISDESGSSSALWGWIAGIAALLLVLVFLFGSGSDNTRTTDIRNPTTSSITTPAPNTAAAPRPAPAAPSRETTGQGTAQ
jgi:hypothetical protein